jgi:hypothetical protein
MPAIPAEIPETSDERLAKDVEFLNNAQQGYAEGGTVDRENYALGSQYQKNLLNKEIPNVRVKKNPDGKLYIAGRYTENGQRVTANVKTFDPETATQKEVDEFLKTLNKQLKGKIIGREEALLNTAKIKLDYTEARKQYITEVMDWLDEASKNPKYKTSEQLQKDLFKEFNKPKYTEAPKGVDPKSIFFQGDKFSIPRETEIFGRKVGAQKVPEKTVNDLSDFFLLKNNPNFEKVRDVAYDFFTNKKADINKYPAEQQKILRNFSRNFIKGQIKGEAGESIFLSGLKQEGFNFQNKVNETVFIKSLEEKIREELSNPNISQNRENFLNKQLETISEQRNSILKDIYQSHPNLYKAAQHPGNFVYEHKLPRYIGDMINLPYDYLARATFSPNAFNKLKFENFDKPLGALITEYNNAGDAASKSEIKNEIESLYNDFNKKTKVKGQGYLDELEFEFGNKVKVKDNTPLISDLTTEDVHRDILRNVKHSNQYFKNEKLNKYVVEGEDFNAFTKDLTNRISKNKGAFYSFPGQAAESELLGTLAGRAGTTISEYSRFAGGPTMAVIGAGLNYPEMREKGFGKTESLGLGGAKALTQDTFNFILDTLPMPAKYSARGALNDVAKEMETKGESPYVEGTGPFKVLDVTKFDWNMFAEKHPGFFQFFNKATDYFSKKLPTKYKVENIIEHEIKKDPNAPFKSQYYDIYDPRSETEKLSSEEENKYKERIREQLFKQNPDVEKEYNKQDINPISAGPVYLGTETAQELKVGGRVGYAEGSNDELEIPTLNEDSYFGKSLKDLPKEGIRGIYYGVKDIPREVPTDPITGQPIEISGSSIKELKQYLASRIPEQKPEIGYRDENFNLSTSKGFGPFANRGTNYEASYTPDQDVGTFSINKGPGYIGANYGREDLGNFSINKTPFTTGAGYNFNKDNLNYGIEALVDKFGNKNMQARLYFKYANGGRASFQTGGSTNFLKMLRNISDSVRELKNSTHMLGYTAKSEGIAKAAEEALTPYAGGFKGNKHETLLQKIQNAKEHLPKEYHGVLDEMKSYADKHAYDAVDDMAKALDKTIDPNLKFENLSKKMFPMEDPLNDAFIIIDPEKGHSVGRYVQRHTVNPETGRGIIQTVDTWDPVNRRFLTEEEQKLIGVQSIEKGKEGLN